MLDPELRAKLDIYAQKQVEGTLTLEEMRDAVRIMREGRVSAAVVSAKSRAAKSKVAPDSDAMLAELQ